MLSLTLALLAGSAAAGPIRLQERQSSAAAYASTSDLSQKLSSYTAPILNGGTQNVDLTWQLTVDDTDAGKKQTIQGFGAAITDSTVSVYNALSSDQQASLLQDIFSANGAGFSLMRHTIAASDLSPNDYSYDDNNGAVDTSVSSFNLGSSGNAMTAFIAAAKGVQSGFKLLGTPWSPPGWMKLNGVISGTTTNNNLNHDYVDEWAQYFVDYLNAFDSAGATVDFVTIQNEPLNSNAGYPTMYVYADESGSLIQDNLGPAISSLNVDIWAYDHNTDQPSYPQTVLDAASDYVSTVAWHCYADPLDWTVLSTFHDSNPSVSQVMTECWTSSDATAWNQAADFTIGPLQNWAEGALAWVLGTDTNDGPNDGGGCTDCRGLFVVDTSAGTYELQVDYYMMAQFSKFMPQGAVVLDGSGSYDYGNGSKVEAVASLNPDGTRTVVIENLFGNEFWAEVTMNSGEGTWNGPIAASGVTTWVLPASS